MPRSFVGIYVVGKAGRGRPGMEYVVDILKDIGIKSYRQLKDPSFDREV